MNKLVVDVEPLSEQRWAKIERGLLARIELAAQQADWASRNARQELPAGGAFSARGMWENWFKSWRAGWLIGAAAAIVLVVWVVGKQSPAPVAVDQPSHVTTGEHASHLAFPGLSLDIKPQSAVVVGAETSAGQLVVLDRGEIVFNVGKRQSSAPLIVQAGGTRVRVVGTRFSVARAGDEGEDVRVEVYEGVVQVESGGHAVRLTAGERWPRQLAAQADVAGASASAVAEHNADDKGSLQSELLPAGQLARSANVKHRQHRAKARPSSAEAQAGNTVAGDSVAGDSVAGESVAGDSVAGDSEGTAFDARELEPRPPAVDPEPEPAVRTRQSIFEEATRLERRDPARASELFRSLETGRDSWAQIALYARGRLEASRGNRELGRRLLQRYLERFPAGSNAQDARAVLQRLR